MGGSSASSSRFVACLLALFMFSPVRFGSASEPICPWESKVFLLGLNSQCPVEISPSPPLQVDGDFLDSVLTSKPRTDYTSVLFYASRCPFSCRIYPTFEKLSFMFPQIEHLAVEQSSAMPSVFSRYGIHGLPSILLVNQSSKSRYRGPKDLYSLIRFYEKTTGFRPVQYFTEDHAVDLQSSENSLMQPLKKGSSLTEIVQRERYLVFAVLFLSLRILASIFPKVVSLLKAFCVSYVPHLNLEIFGETSQLMGRMLHMVDVRRAWNKLRLCKTRNFHESARNARVWASSIASVSLGETSSSARSS